MSSLNILIDEALRRAAEVEPLLYSDEIRSTLEPILQEKLEGIMPNRLTLDSNKPDFESIFLRLVQELQADPVWIDLVPSGTGMTLLRNISAGFTYLGFANERALQEAYPGSATSKNSVLMATRGLGVNPIRRIPSRVNVRLSRLDTGIIGIIPQFTQFTIRNINFFNREQITFNQDDVSADVVLYQGEILSIDAISEGFPSARVEIGTESGLISQEDVYIFVNDQPWQNSLVGLYNYDRHDKVAYVSTLPNSNVEILFGDNRYGAMPSVNDEIHIVWAETDGEVQNYNTMGLEVDPIGLINDQVITGITTSIIYGGADALPIEFYKRHAPHIHSVNKQKGAVNRQQWKTVALEYPNVVDVMFRFQAETHPNKRSYMNHVESTILLKNGQVWTDLEWEKFVEYMQSRTIYNMTFERKEPEAITLNISAKVHCRPRTDLAKLKAKLIADIREQYKPRINTLGFNIYHSDISDILEGKDDYGDLVEYVTDITPANFPVIETAMQYIRIGTINLDMVYTTRNEYGGRKEPW